MQRSAEREDLLATESSARAERPRSPGVVARLLAERGYWSLSPATQLELFEVEDLRGALQVIPSSRGASGMREAIIFTGLLSIWANGPRDSREVRTSAKALADQLRLTWGGRTAEDIRDSVELLKLTSYRVVGEGDGGGWSDIFSLLDRVQTSWEGAPTSPNRQIRAVFGEAIHDQLFDRRNIRPVDILPTGRLTGRRWGAIRGRD